MLCKEVCMKCWRQYDPGMMGAIYALSDWNNSKIWCPAQTRHRDTVDIIRVDTVPPTHCPYKLEHAVAESIKE